MFGFVRANLPLAKLKGILCPVVSFIVNMMEENSRVVEASSDDEFSSVVIPIFPKSVVTAHEWQEVPDPSTISCTETEPADSMSETLELAMLITNCPSHRTNGLDGIQTGRIMKNS